MQHPKILLSLIILIFTISGCKTQDFRALASQSISIDYSGTTCQPLESIVPNDEEIDVNISNTSETGITWVVTVSPSAEKIDYQDMYNTIFFTHVSAGDSITTNFHSPKLTARYNVFCIPDNSDMGIMLQYLLVVKPYTSLK